MPRLENPKHEEFCFLLAKGVKQGEAYKRAGYAENKGAASRLAGSPYIQERVDELRKELMEKVHTALAVPTGENARNLEELGLTMDWVATQFRMIYEQSLQAGAFSAANSAVESIRKLIEAEKHVKAADDPADAPKFNMTDMMNVLDKVAGVVAATKAPAESVMIDITPEDS